MVLLFSFFFLCCLFFVTNLSANPIPVWPDPQQVYIPPAEIAQFTPSLTIWLLLIFLLDFGLDILITYVGLYILDVTKKTDHILYFQDFSRAYFIGAVFLISLIGIFTELMLGMWFVGIFLVLLIVFLSFFLVSHFLLRLPKEDSIFMGFFGVIINAIFWSIVFIF